MVKIYSVSVTNAVCALKSKKAGSSCVSCPAGHYIDKKTNQCQKCPPNTVLSGDNIYGKETDCLFKYTHHNQILQYDFSALTPAGSILNGPSFTAKGTKYYHLFNISLCGAEGHKAAVCRDNITDLPNEDVKGGQLGSSVEAFLCQSTIIPSDGRGLRTALSSQSISLADTFQGATVEKSLNGINARPELFPSPPKRIPDVHFFYRSPQVTTSCKKGRNAVVSLRCNLERTARGDISVPSSLSTDICDLNDNFDTVYMWTEPRLCTGGLTLPLKRTSPCEVIDIWLKVVTGLGVFCAAVLVSLTCYFWKKNKKLEYKYSKLVMTANKECELPAADSCGIMEGEGEENEEEDQVVYANNTSLLAKLKAITTKVTVISSFVFPTPPPTALNIFFVVCILMICSSVLVLIFWYRQGDLDAKFRDASPLSLSLMGDNHYITFSGNPGPQGLHNMSLMANGYFTCYIDAIKPAAGVYHLNVTITNSIYTHSTSWQIRACPSGTEYLNLMLSERGRDIPSCAPLPTDTEDKQQDKASTKPTDSHKREEHDSQRTFWNYWGLHEPRDSHSGDIKECRNSLSLWLWAERTGAQGRQPIGYYNTNMK
ncbi:unnamed protein product [Leuciscus chuanchicus]